MTYTILASRPTVILPLEHYYDFKNDNWLVEDLLGVVSDTIFIKGVEDMGILINEVDSVIREKLMCQQEILRSEAGNDYIINKRSEFLINNIDNVITSSDFEDIFTSVKSAFVYLKLGNWKLALVEMNLTTPSGGFTTSIRNQIITDITNYINNNY